MDYLETYLEKLVDKEYGRNLNIDDLEYHINKFCSNFSWNDAPIYRGIYSRNQLELSNLMLFNPKVIERESANTHNYYTWIIDSSPDWEEYPKRSKSLICATDPWICENFGEQTYRVIPFNGAKIGKCTETDFWNAFDLEEELGDSTISLDDFNSNINTLYSDLFHISNFIYIKYSITPLSCRLFVI